MEFLTVASHFDSTNLTPELCSNACNSMGFSFSAIVSLEFCFCRLTPPVNSVKIKDSDCFELMQCLAGSQQNCGYANYILVYTIRNVIKIKKYFI